MIKHIIYTSFLLLFFFLKYKTLKDYGISIESFDSIFIVVTLTCAFYIKEINRNFETIKFGDIELRKSVQKLQKEQRRYALIDKQGELTFSTFESDELISFRKLKPHKWEVQFAKDPLYFELRGLAEQSSYSVKKKANSTYELSQSVTMMGDDNLPIPTHYILEAYI